MADEGFKLPGSSYAEIAKIIRAYGHAQDEASLEDVASRAAVDKTFVSRNNAFLVGMGVLIGGKRKSLTPAGRALSQALDHELIDRIQDAWRELVDENEFLKRIVSAVRIRNGMDPSQLRAHIAYTAGVPKKPITMTGASAVIDVLRQSGHLAEQDGKIVALAGRESNTTTATSSHSQVALSGAALKELTPLIEESSVCFPVRTAGEGGSVSVRININVSCSVGEVSSLGDSLVALIAKLKQNINESAE